MELRVKSSSSTKDGKGAGQQVRTYLASLSPDVRRRVKEMREVIRAAAPGAIESFSYGIPAFRLDGKPLVWYAGWKNHSSMYPITPAIKRALITELPRYAASKGTVQFPLARPLPSAFVKRFVKARAGEIRKANND